MIIVNALIRISSTFFCTWEVGSSCLNPLIKIFNMKQNNSDEDGCVGKEEMIEEDCLDWTGEDVKGKDCFDWK